MPHLSCFLVSSTGGRPRARWLAGLLLAMGLLGAPLLAQDLSQLGQLAPKNLLADKSIKLTGGVSARYIGYQSWGLDSRRVPLNFLITGNLNLSLMGKFNMPFTFSLSNQNISFAHPFDRAYRFAQPFNRFVLKPTYKGFTLHTGAGCSLTFSPYTLAGHRFNGVGLTYKGKAPLYGGFMYGVLNQAVRIDTSRADSPAQASLNQPSYKRVGLGAQLGYRHQKDLIELIYFTASDQLASLPYTLDSLRISPQQNAVASIKGAKAIGKQWFVQTELAVSGLSSDSRAEAGLRTPTLVNTFGGSLTPNATTTYRKALKLGLDYQGRGFTAGLDYSRIDPGYRTLGAYFFNNDLQTFAAKTVLQLLEGKLSLTLDAGLQQDNLDGSKLQTTNRWVGATTLTFVPSEKTNLTAAYSSFVSSSNLRSQFDYLTAITPYNALDTLDYRQINQNLMVALNTALPSAHASVSRNLSVNLLLQAGSDQQGSLRNQARLFNASLTYTGSHAEHHRSLTASLNAGYNRGAGTSEWLLGPALMGSKSFGPEQIWKSSWTANYNLALPAGQPPTRLLNLRGGIAGSVGKQHTLSLDVVYLLRGASERTDRYQPAFSELTATVGYAYRFALKVKE